MLLSEGMREDPAGFLAFVEQLLAAGHFDVLLPIREQGFSVCARAAARAGWGGHLLDLGSVRRIEREASASKPYNG